MSCKSFVFAVLAAVVAQPSPSVMLASVTVQEQRAEDAIARLLREYDEHLFAQRYDRALAVAESIHLDAANKEGQAIVAAMRASALVGLKRKREAENLIAVAERLAPNAPEPNRMLFLGGLVADDYEVSANALDRMIARFPDQVHELDPEWVWYLLRNEPKGQERRNEDRRIALARLGYGGGAGDYLSVSAVELLMKRGDVAGATELLPYIDAPREVENLLIQRRFHDLWPELEKLAWPSLAKVRKSSVVQAERDLAETPDDVEKLQQLANALRYAGRYEEAIALRSRLPATIEAMAAADEQTGWLLNNIAFAFHHAGRADEADRLFARLNEAPMRDARWRVSMIINRLELLVADGRFDRALPLLQTTEASANTDGNAYAQQLVRRLKYCILSRTGRTGEAETLLPELLSNADDAPGPTIEGLLCAEDLDKAEQVALAALKTDSFHDDFVRALQVEPLVADDPSIWSNGWKQLRLRPAIAKEFERLGRDMPSQLIPPKSNAISQ